MNGKVGKVPPKVRADQILHALSKRNEQDIFLTEVKTGPTYTGPELRKIDALSIKPSWASPCITAYEVKVSRSDFLNDEKWPAYREVSHRFYWACPAGLIRPDEVAVDCGLIWYNPETGGLGTRKKALFRHIELPPLLLYYIVLSRLGPQERHPFFSSRREFFEAYVQDKADRLQLGIMVGPRLVKQVTEANNRAGKAESRGNILKDELALWEKVQVILKEHGIRTDQWNVERQLRERLQTTMPKEALSSLRTIERETGALLRLVVPEAKEDV